MSPLRTAAPGSRKAVGVRISLDDFGTGYSSLASLQDLPLDILKIDKLFIDHVAEDPRRTAFAQAIIRMGKTLGLGLIAEGVETAAQAERLQSLGCRLAQGFYFSRPVPADEIQRMLRTSHAMRVAGGGGPMPSRPIGAHGSGCSNRAPRRSRRCARGSRG
jgi:EAL domain-containing protein (putative c-di-GMP-specific phosphodiesterase class I)